MIDSVSEGVGAPPDLKRTPRRKTALPDPAKVDRLPPHSPEAEQGVLGCVLLSPNDCMGECIEKFKRGDGGLLRSAPPDHLQRPGGDVRPAARPSTSSPSSSASRTRQLLEEVGGLAYLAALPDTVPSAANLRYYLDIVLEKYLLRKMIQTCTGVVGAGLRSRRRGGRAAGRSRARHPAHQRIARRRARPPPSRNWSRRPSTPSRNSTSARACSPASAPASWISTK